MVEANLLGISESKQIIEETMKTNKNQKDNIKVVFNKQNEMSISKGILEEFMFEDFTILGNYIMTNIIIYNKIPMQK